jgi:hypothetical protein
MIPTSSSSTGGIRAAGASRRSSANASSRSASGSRQNEVLPVSTLVGSLRSTVMVERYPG